MCICSELRKLTDGPTDSANLIDSHSIETLLSTVHDYVQSNEHLKTQLSFTLKKTKGTAKVRKPTSEVNKRIAKIFQYKINEYNTTALLENNIERWNKNPESFWVYSQRQEDWKSGNAQHSIIFSCMKLELSDVHSCILRRFYCLVLTRLRAAQHANDDAKTIAQSLLTGFRSESLNKLTKNVNTLLQAGIRYANIATRLGIGSLFILGQDVPRSVWEKWLHKTGRDFEDAMNFLDQVGVIESGKAYEVTAKRVIDYMMKHISRPWIVEKSHQTQLPQKRKGHTHRSSISEPATKRLYHSETGHITVNGQSRGDQLAAKDPSTRPLNYTFDQSPCGSVLPALGTSTVDITINPHSATAESNNPSSIYALLNAADSSAGPKQTTATDAVFNDGCERDFAIETRPEIESSRGRSTALELQVEVCDTFGERGHIHSISDRDSLLSELLNRRTDAMWAQVSSFEIVFEACLVQGIDASHMRRAEKAQKAIQ
ncbi:hypothetical protein EAF04_007035 [Stromatinia cepivora]|nr:hypothetical protein EAF04_007035 [Stromatinia cepivora]